MSASENSTSCVLKNVCPCEWLTKTILATSPPPPKKTVSTHTIHEVRTSRSSEFIKPKYENLNYGNT